MIGTDISKVIAGLPWPILAIGPEERIEAINPAATALLGEGGLGRHYITVLRQPALLDAIESVLADGTPKVTRYLGSDRGRDTTWRVTVSPVELDTGQGVVLGFEDTTAVETAGQMRRDFVANVSHELRTPLTALLGFVETLKGPARDDAAARTRFLDIMEKEAGRMARLVEDLLSLNRVEQDERVRPTTPVDLGALVRETAASLEPLAQKSGLRIDLKLPPEPITVPADMGQLRQVIANLVENALKYGKGGERVEITVTAPRDEPSLRGQGVRLVVRDHGEGIEPHHLGRLTERFYRVDTHRSREVGGTGLGLAIVKHIVNRHRGRLRIESEPGKGAKFTVILPRD